MEDLYISTVWYRVSFVVDLLFKLDSKLVSL